MSRWWWLLAIVAGNMNRLLDSPVDLPLAVQLEAVPLQLDLWGSLGFPDDGFNLSADVASSIPDLAALGALLDVDLPARPWSAMSMPAWN